MQWDPPADPSALVVEEHLGVLELRGPGDRPGTGARVDRVEVGADGVGDAAGIGHVVMRAAAPVADSD
jgi:hypothetical protein